MSKKKDKDLTISIDSEETILVDDNKQNINVLARGRRTLKDMLAPVSIDRSEEDCIKIGDKYARTFSVNGYPNVGYITFLDEIYDYDGVMDVALHIEPSDARLAHDELTKQITAVEAQLEIEMKAGRNKEITRLMAKKESLVAERVKLEQNQQNLFPYMLDVAYMTIQSMDLNLNHKF